MKKFLLTFTAAIYVVLPASNALTPRTIGRVGFGVSALVTAAMIAHMVHRTKPKRNALALKKEKRLTRVIKHLVSIGVPLAAAVGFGYLAFRSTRIKSEPIREALAALSTPHTAFERIPQPTPAMILNARNTILDTTTPEKRLYAILNSYFILDPVGDSELVKWALLNELVTKDIALRIAATQPLFLDTKEQALHTHLKNYTNRISLHERIAALTHILPSQHAKAINQEHHTILTHNTTLAQLEAVRDIMCAATNIRAYLNTRRTQTAEQRALRHQTIQNWHNEIKAAQEKLKKQGGTLAISVPNPDEINFLDQDTQDLVLLKTLLREHPATEQQPKLKAQLDAEINELNASLNPIEKEKLRSIIERTKSAIGDIHALERHIGKLALTIQATNAQVHEVQSAIAEVKAVFEH